MVYKVKGYKIIIKQISSIFKIIKFYKHRQGSPLTLPQLELHILLNLLIKTKSVLSLPF